MESIYDYVIVGGGSAGCVLANRLTADGITRVALLEAGPDRSSLNIRVPLFYSKATVDPRFGWGFESESEPHAAERNILLKRGRVMGGSSSINGLIFTRGHPQDYDDWASGGASGWGYSDVLPYFRRLERNWRGESPDHGGSGPMVVSRMERDEALEEGILTAARARGYPLNDDFDRFGADGFGCFDTTTDRGRRASAATHYLDPVRNRRNLTILSDAMATRILFEGSRAVAVDYQRRGRAHRLVATREIIVSAGTYSSAHLLMLSGIGPADHLRDHGIEVICHNPNVGQNLQEHPVANMMFATTGNSKFDQQLRLDRLVRELVRWTIRGKGILSGMPVAAVGFFRSDSSLSRPDIETAFITSTINQRPWFPGIRGPNPGALWCATWLLRPKSRGQVRLQSADAFRPPAITHNFLADDADMAALISALREIRALAATQPLSKQIDEEKVPGPAVRCDSEIADYIRRSMIPGAHPTSTCAMGTDETAVVDPELRVRGVESLRVIDASVMPTVPAGHTNAATLMIAERGADLLTASTPVRT